MFRASRLYARPLAIYKAKLVVLQNWNSTHNRFVPYRPF